jgi:thermitase
MTMSLNQTGGRRRLLAAVAALAAVIAPAESAGTVPVAAAVGPLFESQVAVMPSASTRSQRLLVKFVPTANGGLRAAAAGDEDLGKMKTRVHLIRIDEDESLDVKLAEYRARKDVVYAESNYTAFATVLNDPDDSSYSSQWALAQTQAIGGWSLYPGAYGVGGGANIGIVDSGVDLAHPDLASQLDLAGAANCVNESEACAPGSALDDAGHGTHATGIAAAATNNGFGVAGTAFSSRVLPVKVLDAAGAGSYAAVTSGILWAAEHGARVISLSLGGLFYSKTLCDAVAIATERYHALVVAAAGNGGSSNLQYPAGCPGAVAVAATNASDQAASWSNYGSGVFVSAPGVSIYSTYPPSTFATLSGTSMATPAVAGLAALLFGQDPSRSPDDVKLILARSADKVGEVRYSSRPSSLCPDCTHHPRYGYGRINVRRALGGPDFSLRVFPASRTVRRGANASYRVAVSGNSGFDAPVAPIASGLPPGSRTSFGPSLVKQASILRIRVPKGTPRGTYPFTVSATGDGLTRSVNLSLRVTR